MQNQITISSEILFKIPAEISVKCKGSFIQTFVSTSTSFPKMNNNNLRFF